MMTIPRSGVGCRLLIGARVGAHRVPFVDGGEEIRFLPLKDAQDESDGADGSHGQRRGKGGDLTHALDHDRKSAAPGATGTEAQA